MNPCIDESGENITFGIPLPLHHLGLKETSPENLFPRAGDEEEEEKNEHLAGAFTQGVDPPHLARRSR